VLIVIELLAFLRSPLRFAERLSAHRLGFVAVTRWRRWLVLCVGRWDYSRWSNYAAGDLLERSLHDTDELQDLWLRCALPAITTIMTLFAGDLTVGLLPPDGHWWVLALTLVVVQALGVLALLTNFGPLLRADRAVRRTRGSYQAAVVELSAMVPELALLGEEEFAVLLLDSKRQLLRDAEEEQRRTQRWSQPVPIVATVLALLLLWLLHPHASPTWIVVVAMLALSGAESLNGIRSSLVTALAVSAAAERLEDLEEGPFEAFAVWPDDATIRAERVTIQEGATLLLHHASFSVAPQKRIAIIGASGVGKSTLLRALCGLEPVNDGTVSIGGVPVRSIDEGALRLHLSYVASEPGLTRGYAGDVVRVGRKETRDSLHDLSLLGIPSNDGTRWDELSHGERQRVAIVRSLVTSPSILVLDEPTSGLGSEETTNILRLLESAHATVIIATHDPLVMAWCDEILELTDSNLRSVSR
jgi:ABC-type transport system involved in cytochrome bd biosynthesis fused ATPase/permease subunit